MSVRKSSYVGHPRCTMFKGTFVASTSRRLLSNTLENLRSTGLSQKKTHKSNENERIVSIRMSMLNPRVHERHIYHIYGNTKYFKNFHQRKNVHFTKEYSIFLSRSTSYIQNSVLTFRNSIEFLRRPSANFYTESFSIQGVCQLISAGVFVLGASCMLKVQSSLYW